MADDTADTVDDTADPAGPADDTADDTSDTAGAVDDTADVDTSSVDARSVAVWIAAWGREVAAADIRSGRQRFAPGLVAFGTHADVVVGRDAVEAEQWAQIWPAIEGFRFEIDRLRVIVSPDRLLAVAIVPWRSTGIGPEGAPFDRPGRATVVLERVAVGATWAGTHTHFSLARGVPSSTHGTRVASR